MNTPLPTGYNAIARVMSRGLLSERGLCNVADVTPVRSTSITGVLMRYTLFLYNDESAHADVTPEQMEESKAAFGAYIGALQEAGVFVDTDWLQPSSTATVITLRGGQRRVQDGPYADTKEQLGGFFVIKVPDLDAALAWAEKCPTAPYGFIEVRPSAM